MGLPNIDITFKEKGITAIERGERGTVVLILQDEVIEPVEILSPVDIPEGLNEFNKDQIEKALMGYVTPPRKVIVLTVATPLEEAGADYTEVQNYLETIRWDYVAIPEIRDEDTSSFATWIKALRDTKDKKVKAVLPNQAADHEGIINFTADEIETSEQIYTTAEYCARVAGLIAGTPLTISCTFAPLPEVLDCKKFTKEELDGKIDAGEFVLYNDGEKVKVGRGVNSLVTTTQDKLSSFKKIKIVEAMDLVFDDITKTAEDSYLGKYSNSYDNKCLLIMAILGYLEGLEVDGILARGSVNIGIDIDKQINYLKSKGIDIETMKEIDIKKADTQDKVFLKGSIKILDAIEEIFLPISI